MTLFRPEEILAALHGGPLTWRLLLARLGFVADQVPIRSWWWKLWNRTAYLCEQVEERDARTLHGILDDMVALGLIVLRGDPKVGPWALPPPREPSAEAKRIAYLEEGIRLYGSLCERVEPGKNLSVPCDLWATLEEWKKKGAAEAK